MGYLIGFGFGMFVALFMWAYFEIGRRMGFRIGVLEGYMIGKFQDQCSRTYPKAQKIIDELEAHMAWKLSLDEPIEDEE